MERYIWHYFHNSSAGRTLLAQTDVHKVHVVLPNVITGVEEQFVLSINEQDRQTLVAFDGCLLAGSPKRM